MSWRGINDPFCGHSCSDGVMVPQEKTMLKTMLDLNPWGSPSVVEVVKEDYESPCLMKKPMKT